jgi:site-specific recombinase
MDSFAMIIFMIPDISPFYIIFSGLLFFILGIIAAIFYERKLTTKIKDNLSYPLGPDQEIEEMSSNEISNRFHEIWFDTQTS